MAEQNKPFVITDRRKFSLDGTPRPDADPSPEREEQEGREEVQPTRAANVPLEFPSAQSSASAERTGAKPATEPSAAEPHAATAPDEVSAPPDLPPPPTAQEMDQVNAAYQATSDRLETAVRATNPGMERPPEMNFTQVVQSVYMTAILQLGGGTEPGQAPRVDLMGARQSIDMLSVLAEKTKGNLVADEQRLLDSALFELRMAFLEVTQALARSASARQPGPGVPGAPGKPSIVR